MRFLLLFFASTFFGSVVSAQELFLIPTLGTQRVEFRGRSAHQENGSRYAGSAGVELGLRTRSSWQFRSGLGWAERGVIDSGFTIQMHYVEVPLLADFRSVGESGKFRFTFGVVGGHLFAAKNAGANLKQEGVFAPYDLAWTTGIGGEWLISTHHFLSLEALYQRGIFTLARPASFDAFHSNFRVKLGFGFRTRLLD